MNGDVRIAVFGSSRPRPGSESYEDARMVGKALGGAGWTVVTGGYMGVMEAASKGAKEAGAGTIGVTTAFYDERNLKPNEFVDTEIKVPTYGERLLKLVEISDGYVVMRGGSGTLTELFLTWELVKNTSVPLRPIVLHGAQWRRIMEMLGKELGDELSFSSYLHLLKYSTDPDETVELIRNGLEKSR